VVEERAPASVSKPPERTRLVCFDAEHGYVDTPLHWRPDLAPGTELEGPVIVEEFGSTVPVHPGFRVRVDDYRNLIVTPIKTGSQA
jgi:N-methylhydantoinase A